MVRLHADKSRHRPRSAGPIEELLRAKLGAFFRPTQMEAAGLTRDQPRADDRGLLPVRASRGTGGGDGSAARRAPATEGHRRRSHACRRGASVAPPPRRPRRQVDMSPDVAASVRARLLARAKAQREEFERTLARYAAERLLYRLGMSPARERCILKGASLLTVWMPDPYRATRDVDVLSFGSPDDAAIRALVEEICAEPCPEDGLRF